MDTKYNFKSKWDTDTAIGWWNTSRVELNAIIELYNRWQMEDAFSPEKATLVLSKIEYGKQTIGSQDGGDGYWDELDEMEKFVRKCLKT